MKSTMFAIVWGFLIRLFILSSAAAQPFLPPVMINPNPDTDTLVDSDLSVVVDKSGVLHAVWISENDYTGDSSTDGDIFYIHSTGSGWSAPELVNSYGKSDFAWDTDPKLAIGPKGELHCVWWSNVNYASTGYDVDIFYSRNDGDGWSDAEIVNSHAVADNVPVEFNSDTNPVISVFSDGSLVVAWISTYHLISGEPPVNIGTDSDILYSINTGNGWSNAQPLNANAATDSGDDYQVSLTVTLDDTLVAAWTTLYILRPDNGIGTDSDIVWSRTLTPLGLDWTTPFELAAYARTDNVWDLFVNVVAIGSGNEIEYHFVWESQAANNGQSADLDILHTVIRPNDAMPPAKNPVPVNSHALTDANGDDDRRPSLNVEPGGVLHCTWHSNYNLVLLPGMETGSDDDIYHSTNATGGSEWSPADVVNVSAWDDQNVALNSIDEFPFMVCAPNGSIAVGWETLNEKILAPAIPDIGNDWDLVGAFGLGRMVTRPRLVNIDGENDDAVPFPEDTGVHMAMAPDGVVHAVWVSRNRDIGPSATDDDADIFHASLYAGKWSAAHLVNATGYGDHGLDYDCFLAIDHEGTLHVVWSSNVDITGGTGADTDIFLASSSDKGLTWSTPELVNTTGLTDTAEIHRDYDANPQIAIGAQGVIHAVWEGNIALAFTPPIPDSTHSNIFYAKRVNGTWSYPELVNEAYARTVLGRDYNPVLLLDQTGTPQVLWVSEADYLGAGGDPDIFFSTRAGGSWSAPDFVNDADSGIKAVNNVAAAFSPNGTLYAVWDSTRDTQGAGMDFDLLINSRTGESWGTPQLLHDQGRSILDVLSGDIQPSIAFDADGILHVAWVSNYPFLGTAGTDPDIFYTAINLNDPLPATSLIILANASGHADPETSDASVDSEPQVLIDNHGRAHFAWVSSEALGGTIGDDLDILYARTILPLVEDVRPGFYLW